MDGLAIAFRCEIAQADALSCKGIYMRMKALLGGLAAATLAAQPIAATASSRVAASVESENAMGGESSLLGLGVFIAVVAAFYLIASSDDEPVSA